MPIAPYVGMPALIVFGVTMWTMCGTSANAWRGCRGHLLAFMKDVEKCPFQQFHCPLVGINSPQIDALRKSGCESVLEWVFFLFLFFWGKGLGGSCKAKIDPKQKHRLRQRVEVAEILFTARLRGLFCGAIGWAAGLPKTSFERRAAELSLSICGLGRKGFLG